MTVPKWATALLAIVLIVSVSSLSVAVAGATAMPDNRHSAALHGGIYQTETPTENETTQHTNPDRTDKEGNIGDIRKWLAGTLGDRLSGSAIQISQGQYERGRALLGDSYSDLLGKYVDVTGEAEGETTATEFRKARQLQRELASTTDQYRETLNEYREARQNGNETRARRLARKLNRLAADINQTTASLTQTYDEISNETGVRLRNATDAVLELRRNITSRQAAINEDIFVKTVLSASVREARVSFLTPATITGKITRANGSALANQTVTLRVTGESIRTKTDSQGRFSVLFRPTTVPLGQQNLTVTYVPTNTSVYLGATDSITVVISQVQPTLVLRDTPEAAQFNDRVTVTGRVSADDIGASNVPVVITLGGVRLGTTRTASDGSFAATVRIPATVENGSRTLRARVPLDGKALAATNATRDVRIEPTATKLVVQGDGQNGTVVQATGRLVTSNQTPVASQRIVLSIAGQRVGTVQTGSDGRFNTTVTVPLPARPESQSKTVTLVATYRATGTNLKSAQATAGIQLSPTGTTGSDATGTTGGNGSETSSLIALVTNPIVWVVGIAVVAAGALGAFWWRTDDDDHANTGQDDNTDIDKRDAQSGRADNAGEQFLIAARERLDAGEFDAAVRAAYAAARRRVTRLSDLPQGGTHWECYAACETADVDGERLAALRELTELYERAAFAPGSLDSERAQRAVTRADEFARDLPTDSDEMR